MTKVLLYSGGMDSYLIDKLEQPEVKLFLDLGTESAAIERSKLPEDVVIDESLNLASFELPNKIIPMRNLYMGMVALQYGNQVILGATAGDTTKDKDQVFASKATSLLRYILTDPGKRPTTYSEYEQISIELPYKDVTKTQLLGRYLTEHALEPFLNESYSCYSGSHQECGGCRSCFRKWVALVNNDVFEHRFEQDPYKFKLAALAHLGRKDRGLEQTETEQAIQKYEEHQNPSD